MNKIKKYCKSAFTMTEALLVMGIVGILAALSTMALNSVKPDTELIMMRKAYITLTKADREMLSDKMLYPNAEVMAMKYGETLTNMFAVSYGFTDPTFLDTPYQFSGTNEFIYYPYQHCNGNSFSPINVGIVKPSNTSRFESLGVQLYGDCFLMTVVKAKNSGDISKIGNDGYMCFLTRDISTASEHLDFYPVPNGTVFYNTTMNLTNRNYRFNNTYILNHGGHTCGNAHALYTSSSGTTQQTTVPPTPTYNNTSYSEPCNRIMSRTLSILGSSIILASNNTVNILNKTRDTSGLCKSGSYTSWKSPVTNWCIPNTSASNTAYYCGSNSIYTRHKVNNIVFCTNWLNNITINNTAYAALTVDDEFCKTPCTNINYLSYNKSGANAYGYNIVANNSTNTFRDQFLNGALSCYSGSATTNYAVFMQNVACVPQNTAIRVYCGSTIGTSQILIPIYHPTSGKRCLDLAQNKVVSAPADFCLSSSSSGVTTPTLSSFTGGLFNFGSESGETSSATAVNTTITYKPEDLSKYEMYILGQGFTDLSLDKTNNKFLNSTSITKNNKYAVSLAERVAKIGDATIKTNGATFTTPDGIYWDITDNFNTTNPHALVNVYVDGQSSSSTACSYSDSCKNPNKFIFKVEKMGKVTPVLASDTSKVDPIGCSYLRYPNINKRKQIPTDATVNPCFK